MNDSLIRIGISACLLGEKVRFDGQHKRSDFLCDVLGAYVEFVPVCPEVEVGMGIPRETIRLVGSDAALPRLIATKSGKDYTDQMTRFSDKRIKQLRQMDLCGYVFKKDSPSCGVWRVKVYPGSIESAAMPLRTGRGLFAEAFLRQCPSIPVEEEGRLNDLSIRENFIERIFAYRRLKTLFEQKWTIGDLVQFHSNEKLNLMAHSPEAYRALGRLVGSAKAFARRDLKLQYESGFCHAMAAMATRGRQTNVLMHMAGYFKRLLDDGDRTELATVIMDYRAGLLPVIVPIVLLRHYVRRYDMAYLARQSYLQPHPKELVLRNHV